MSTVFTTHRRVAMMLALAAVSWAMATRGQTLDTRGSYDHRIIPGDRLRISVAEQIDLNRVYAVAGDGTLDFGFIGRISVADMTVGEVAEEIERLLEKDYFKNATVSVDVADFVEGAVLVMGAVAQPGTIGLRGDEILTLMEAITMRGGLGRDAAGSEVRILRWKPRGGMERQVLNVDVQSMFETLDFSKDQYLRPRDIVFVPSLGQTGRESSEFLALGDVSSPGFHPCPEGTDVIRAITTMGGLTRQGNVEAARILRPNRAGGYSVILVNLARLLGAADMTQNVKILPGDIFFIPSGGYSSQGRVYLLGAVAKVGAISLPLTEDVTLARLILSVGGFGQYANENKVKLIRTAPDGTKKTLFVDVGTILKTGAFENDVPLQDGDIVIVAERILGI